MSWNNTRGLELYPAQEEAVLALLTDSNVVLATPTGSGKSLVAIGAHLIALARGERSYYTAPIKALVNEKFFALVEIFGPERVGLITGDSSVNPDAPIICCTAEILAAIAMRGSDVDSISLVVMDEFHYYADTERGWAWQVPLLTLNRSQFLLMSATLGDVSGIMADLQRRTGRDTVLVSSAERPVPLAFEYALTPVQDTVEQLLHTDRAPVYIVHPSQAEAFERAQAMLSSRIIGPEAKAAIAASIGDFRFNTAFGKVLSRLVRAGIGVHHAGMLPRYRRLVEQLAQTGHLRVICGTDTLGVGINVPIRTVLITSLVKFDGYRLRRLTAREFHQISGRAGRAGFDTIGTVVVQAPEHEIENARRVAKAGTDPKRLARVQRVKPREGTVSWSRATFERLIAAAPEQLQSQMRMTHAMVLAALARAEDSPNEDAVTLIRNLIADSHESGIGKLRLTRRALAIGRTLLDAGIIERRIADGTSQFALTVELQPDFALNQPLSPFAVEVITALDATADDFALDAISVIEATLDDPRPVLAQQEFAARGEAMAAMKAEGLDYDARMAVLEDVSWPKPLIEILEPMFETYRRFRPWAADYELSAKSVVRDMWERAMDFPQFIRHYRLVRSEGLVLRYLADAYRALKRTIPEDLKTEQLRDVIEWLGEIVRGVDSSLLDEWSNSGGVSSAGRSEIAPPPTADRRALRVIIRNAMFYRVQLAALGRWTELGELDGPSGFDADAWQVAIEEYLAEHSDLGTGQQARGARFFSIDESAPTWYGRQVFDDPAGDGDWGFDVQVDTAEWEATGVAEVRVVRLGRI